MSRYLFSLGASVLALSLCFVACGDDEETTATTASGGSSSTSNGGNGGTTSAGGNGGDGGDACTETVTPCAGCGDLLNDVIGDPGALCKCNGPPSSSDILESLIGCACSTCASDCPDLCSGSGPPSDGCLDCQQNMCSTDWDGCLADEEIGSGSGGNGGSAGGAGGAGGAAGGAGGAGGN